MDREMILRMDLEEAEDMPENLVLQIFVPADAYLWVHHGNDPETGTPGTMISTVISQEVFEGMQEYLTQRRLERELL